MEANRWVAALLLVVTFLLGISLGFIIHSLLPGDDRGPRPPMEARRGAYGTMPPLMDRVIEGLDLTPEQQAEFERILEDNRWKLMQLQREVIRPRTRAIADSTRMAIEAILTPEQREKFRDLQRRMRRSARPGRRMPRLE